MRKAKSLLGVVAFAVLAAACSQQPVNRNASMPLTTVKSVDLDRYTGLWYEVARLPNSFERGCVAVTAQYAKNTDGSIKVLNRCRKLKFDGEQDVVEGRARVVGVGKLGVTFFWPFEGSYWILDLADDYSWSLVGEPSGRYLWILSRNPHLSAEVRSKLDGKLIAEGYNTAALYWTPQP